MTENLVCLPSAESKTLPTPASPAPAGMGPCIGQLLTPESISDRPEDKSDFAIAAGTSTGLQVTYDRRYDGSKGVPVIIVHVNRA